MSVLKAAIALICAYAILNAVGNVSWKSFLVAGAFFGILYAVGWLFLRNLSLRGPE